MTSTLAINNGSITERRDYRQFAANVVGNAVVDSPAVEREALLDRLQAAGVNLVRFLHVAKDDRLAESSGRKISEYQPNYAEWEAGFPYLDAWMDSLAKRGMKAWLTCHHRQRLTQSEAAQLKTPGLADVLFGPRVAGIEKGEISDLFFWFPELLDIVAYKAEKFASRYAKHEALGLMTIANEKWATRGRIYAMNQRNEPGASAYNTAWFTKLDGYLFVTGHTEKEMTAAALEEFKACVGYGVYADLYDVLIASGVSCPINCSAIFGGTRISALAESQAGDFDDFHIYPESGNDPFLPDASRQFADVCRALHVAGRALTCSEWGSVWQDGPLKGQRSTSWTTAPEVVGQAAAESGVSACCHYAAALGKLGDQQVGNYDAFEDPGFIASFHAGAEKFRQTARVSLPVRELIAEDLWGYKLSGAAYVPPMIPGIQSWAMEVGGVVLPEIAWLT